jgi:hypothetical protein
VADDPVATIDALDNMSATLGRGRTRGAHLASAGLKLLNVVPRNPELDDWREQVEASLRALAE